MHNLNPFSCKGTISRSAFSTAALVLMLVLFATCAVAEMRRIPEFILWINLAASIAAAAAVVCTAAKRCRTLGISPWWSLVSIIPIAAIILLLYLLFAVKKTPPLQSPTDSSTETVLAEPAELDLTDDEASDLKGRLAEVFTPLLVLFYIGYCIAGLYFFGGFIEWLFDVRSGFLRFVAFFVGLMLVRIPIVNLFMMGGTAYYLAEVLDWGWPLAVLFCFPTIGLMLLFGAGAAVETIASKLLGR